MSIVSEDINAYLMQHTSEPNAVLNEIERETNLKSMYPRMLSGKIQGRFLSMVSRMICPKSILEIGTFTGYSAVCLAEGLAKGGQIHSIEINEELREMHERYFEAAGVNSKVMVHYGNAMDILPISGIKFDLVFIDADKVNYSNYFDVCIDLLHSGGFIIVENVLWSGKVLTGYSGKKDKDTDALKKFNDKIQKDSRVENVMIPLRDGMTLIQKIC